MGSIERTVFGNSFNHKLNDKLDNVCYTTHRNQEQLLLQKGTRIMKVITSAICYMGEREAIFRFMEYSFAKHTHLQDKQKDRIGMSSGK